MTIVIFGSVKGSFAVSAHVLKVLYYCGPIFSVWFRHCGDVVGGGEFCALCSMLLKFLEFPLLCCSYRIYVLYISSKALCPNNVQFCSYLCSCFCVVVPRLSCSVVDYCLFLQIEGTVHWYAIQALSLSLRGCAKVEMLYNSRMLYLYNNLRMFI